MLARDRMGQVIERWFLIEPLLFSVWTTHNLVVETRIRTIRVRRGRIEYNPNFINELSRRQLETVMQYEATRILLKHPYHRRKENSELAYIASNVTLQEYLQTDLDFPRARDLFGTDEFDRQYFEFYYYKLQEMTEAAVDLALGGNGESGGAIRREEEKVEGQEGKRALEHWSIGAKGGTGAFSPAPQRPNAPAPQCPPLEEYTNVQVSGLENTKDWDTDELVTDRINERIRTAQENHSWGTVAGHLRERVLATLKPKLNYRAILRHFRASILSTRRILTRMKPSRRYGFIYMGSRRDFSTRLLFAVDVSGSIDSKDLARGFSIINQFFKYGIESIDVIQFDTDIRGQPLALKRARREITVVGRGGTSFAPVIEYIDEHRNYDGLIIFTDGYAPTPPRPRNKGTRILWLFNNETSYHRMRKGLYQIGHAVFLKED